MRLRRGRPDAAAAAAGAAAVHGAEPGAGQPLWRLAAAQYAVSRGHPAENLPHDRKKLGARGQCALCRRLQAGRRRDGARLRLRAGRGHRRRVERGHARQPERRCARLCGRGRRIRQGHRRGRAGARRGRARAPAARAARGKNGPAAVPARPELVEHGAHERPACRTSSRRRRRTCTAPGRNS